MPLTVGGLDQRRRAAASTSSVTTASTSSGSRSAVSSRSSWPTSVPTSSAGWRSSEPRAAGAACPARSLRSPSPRCRPGTTRAPLYELTRALLSPADARLLERHELLREARLRQPPSIYVYLASSGRRVVVESPVALVRPRADARAQRRWRRARPSGERRAARPPPLGEPTTRHRGRGAPDGLRPRERRSAVARGFLLLSGPRRVHERGRRGPRSTTTRRSSARSHSRSAHSHIVR